MKHKTLPIVILFVILLICTPTESFKPRQNDFSLVKDSFFVPEEIQLSDDAFHQSNRVFHIETWYFDATFQDNTSIVIVTCLFQIKKTGFLLHGIYLYHNTEVSYVKRNITPLTHVNYVMDRPYLKINDNLIIDGYINKTSNEWIYDISAENNEITIDLRFTKVAAGWKGNHMLGWWLAIPKLDVKGTILIKGKQFFVQGNGYHDHNIYPVYIPLLADGYHFGSFGEGSIQLTWAQLQKNKMQSNFLAIISRDGFNVSMIPEEDVKFRITEKMIDHAEIIPKTCHLVINNTQIQAEITMNTEKIHFIRIMAVKYWRFHLHISGFISVGERTEEIDTVDIAEFLHFF